MSTLNKQELELTLEGILKEIAPIIQGRDPKLVALEFLERNIVTQVEKYLMRYIGCHGVPEQIGLLGCLYEKLKEEEPKPRTEGGGEPTRDSEVQSCALLEGRAEPRPVKKGKRAIL